MRQGIEKPLPGKVALVAGVTRGAAVRAEVRRRELLAASEKYTDELEGEVGAPTARQRARAAGLVRRVVARSRHMAG